LLGIARAQVVQVLARAGDVPGNASCVKGFPSDPLLMFVKALDVARFVALGCRAVLRQIDSRADRRDSKWPGSPDGAELGGSARSIRVST
jgi:hypothetical protein